MENGNARRVAIACQGGGSHTAFTAGVLQGLLKDLPSDVKVVALSGTSGGAICAAMAWEGLLRNDLPLAIGKLTEFWKVMSARDPLDRVLNQLAVGVLSLRDMMVLPEISPYTLPTWAADLFRERLTKFFDFEQLRQLAAEPEAPSLQIGAIEVLSGHFELFTGKELCVECLLASAAIPELFRAVTVPNRGVYWDGLFSQNPPIHNLVYHNIDEIWLIQINPRACSQIPTATHEILDRRNALAGNLSMEQELGFIETFNRGIASGQIKGPNLRQIQISRIALDRRLPYRSKMDRGAAMLEDLREYGQTKSRWFLRGRHAGRMEMDGVGIGP